MTRVHRDRCQIARRLLAASPRPRAGPQVLRELYVVAGSKLGLRSAEAASAVRPLVPTVALVEDAPLLLRAVAAAERWQISLWDAQIVEAARRAGAATLLSEDVEDPFANPWHA